MIRTIIKLNLNINYIVACNNTAEHCALNTLVNSRKRKRRGILFCNC